MREDIMCIGGTSQWPATLFRGIDQWGDRYGYILVDPIGGAIGAFSVGDGISNGGQSRTPICRLPNVEHNEQSFPLLVLYRKEVVDSGGAGRWRGGLSAETCFVPHHTSVITHDTLSSGNAIPTSTGMMGGYPATVNVYKFKRDTDIKERLAKRELIGDIAEVRGRTEELGLRQENFSQHPADVYSVIWTAAGGFGDPMERDPERVWRDVVENRAVSRDAAAAIYGVIVTADERLDLEATKRLRAERRDARRRKSGAVKKLDGKVVARISDNLELRKVNGGLHTSCAKCAADLGPVRDNYKSACVRADEEIAASNPNVGDWRRYIDERPVFRQFFCPGCGALIENEIAREGDEVLRDIELDLE
jgi:N-methylhydantoinase B